MEKDFEKELARKLNQRTIGPSSNAWERVNLQRSKPRKKSAPIIYWIAAALVLGIGLTFVDFESGKSGPDSVVTTTPQPVQKPDIAPEEPPIVQTKVVIQKPTFRAAESTCIIKAETTRNRAPQTAISQPIAGLRQNVKEQKTLEILIAVEQLAQSGKQPTEDDVDALIEKARREIASGNGLSKPTDATALLKSSESELDESFRAGVFENLFKHKKIKVALSSH